MDGLLGGPKGMLAPPLKLLGGPGPPFSYAYAVWQIIYLCVEAGKCLKTILLYRKIFLGLLNYFYTQKKTCFTEEAFMHIVVQRNQRMIEDL